MLRTMQLARGHFHLRKVQVYQPIVCGVFGGQQLRNLYFAITRTKLSVTILVRLFRHTKAMREIFQKRQSE